MAISSNIVVVGISDLLKVVDSRGDGYNPNIRLVMIQTMMHLPTANDEEDDDDADNDDTKLANVAML